MKNGAIINCLSWPLDLSAKSVIRRYTDARINPSFGCKGLNSWHTLIVLLYWLFSEVPTCCLSITILMWHYWNVTRFWKTWLIVLKLKFELLLVLNSSIFAEQNGCYDAVIMCTVAELWTLTWTVLTRHCSEKNAFFIVQLLIWVGPYILVSYPWYEHVNSCRKRWCLAVAANGWHNWAIRNLSLCFSVVSGCLAPWCTNR